MFGLASGEEEKEKKLKQAFRRIKEELDDHRDSINDNTQEIQANFDFSIEIEKRLSKLEEKFEQTTLLLSAMAEKLNLKFIQDYSFDKEVWLTRKEKDILVSAIELCEQNKVTTIQEISASSCYEPELVKDSLVELSRKGIPILVREVNSSAYLEIDQSFLKAQREKKLIDLS
ncbi:MAG TPA: hypothetical protein ENN46_01720 [Candidatus Woesearchaeota archaeon]|nr:hypothetical protein [Candidatus Woesearchaeota archaeon]